MKENQQGLLLPGVGDLGTCLCTPPHPPAFLLSTRATQARAALRPQRPCITCRNLVKPADSWCDLLCLCAPTQAVLKNSGSLLCGAILLDSTWIVSAAHCFDTIWSWRNITVVMGRYGLSLASDQRAFSNGLWLRGRGSMIHQPP